ncbi:pirin family protein [Larkinella ripae]
MNTFLQTEAQIYLADQRGCTQSAGYRSFHTFNFGSYWHESRQPFGTLTAFHDDTLLAGESHAIAVAEPTDVLLLPVVGGIELVDSLGESHFLGAGEAMQFTAFPGQEYRLINPFDTEAVNFLQIWRKADPAHRQNFPVSGFTLENRNQLLALFPTAKPENRVYVGMYGGRQEGTYWLTNPRKRLFVFILEGAFEVQNRLLHPRDGLALQYLDELEFEALSNDALLLILEV